MEDNQLIARTEPNQNMGKIIRCAIYLSVFALLINLHGADSLFVQGMVHGICDNTSYLYSSSEDCVFTAPMPLRADSVENEFLAAYLSSNGTVTELFPGYNKDIAQNIGIFSRIRCFNIASDSDFSRFAIIYDYILTGYTPPDTKVTVPITTAIGLAIVERSGELKGKIRIPNELSLLPQQFNVILTGSGINAKPLVYNSQIGLLLYAENGASFEKLPIEDFQGTVAYLCKDNCLYYVRKQENSDCSVLRYDLTSRIEYDTGIHFSSSLANNDLKLSPNGNTILFKRTSEELCLGLFSEGQWNICGLQANGSIGHSLSEDGSFIIWESKEKSFLYDVISKKQVQIDASLSDAHNSILSPSGTNMLYMANDGAGKKQLWKCTELGNSMTLSLGIGNHLCGLPFLPNEQSLSKLKQLEAVFVWNNMKFEPFNGKLEAGQGFWLYSKETRQIYMSGRLAAPQKQHKGWNLLVASLYDDQPSNACFAFDDKNEVYLHTNEKLKNQVYWIFVK